MNNSINETHDVMRRSWIESANDLRTDFPIQNLPFGLFRRRIQRRGRPHIGVAIGDTILDIHECAKEGLFDGPARQAAAACREWSLNRLMSMGHSSWSALRRQISELLSADCPRLRDNPDLREKTLVPMAKARMFLPCRIGDYSDFYASIYHATNVGRTFRPDNPLLPNYKYVPIGYHGRASSIVVSGTDVCRPSGQTMDDDGGKPDFGPTSRLDYELEVGIFIGPGNRLGSPVTIADAGSQVFGLCLLNDWSARDVQKWEYQPLGPFLSKSFATTISPWIVTMEALAPYRVPAFARGNDDPEPLPYLDSDDDQRHGGVDLTLEVWLSSQQMSRQQIDPIRLTRGNFRDMYWTIAQLVTHHASNGCNLRPGDLLASGTVSGAERGSMGCLLELTSRGADPIELPTGERRRFLEDGDEVILRGYCAREGFARIGFGECRGIVQPARQ